MDNVCNRCLFSIPSKVEIAEEQEYLRCYFPLYLFFWSQSACNSSIFRCPLQFSYHELTVNLMFDIRHRNTPRYMYIWDLFQDISNIHSCNSRSFASNNFYTQRPSLDSLFNWTRFLELEQQFGTRCLLHKKSLKIWL